MASASVQREGLLYAYRIEERNDGRSSYCMSVISRSGVPVHGSSPGNCIFHLSYYELSRCPDEKICLYLIVNRGSTL